MPLSFWPSLRSKEDSLKDLPELLRDKPGQTWTAEDIAEALSKPSRLSIIEKQEQEIIKALEVGETVRALIPEANAEIEAERESDLLANPQECLRLLKELKAAYKSLLSAVELQNQK